MLSPSTSRPRPYHHKDLKAQLLAVAETLLSEQGAAAVTLRELARRTGVSHNAPYRHFATRDTLLAALTAAGFEALGRALAQAPRDGPPIVAAGLAYVRFALARPALFRLMFSGLVSDPDASAKAATSLAAALATTRTTFGEEGLADALLSGWSFVHGLAGLLLDGQVPEAMRAGRDDETLAHDVLHATAHALGVLNGAA